MGKMIVIGLTVMILTSVFYAPAYVRAEGEWEGVGMAMGALTFIDIVRDGSLDWPKAVLSNNRHRHCHPRGCNCYDNWHDNYYGSHAYWEGYYRERARIEKRKQRYEYHQGQRDARYYCDYGY